MFNEYFSNLITDNSTVVDIWKTFDIDSFIKDDNFIFHTLNPHENLMDLSFKYYDSIDDWWVIFLFNKFWDVNFCILQDDTIKNTQDKYLFNLQNYNVLDKKEKNITKYMIRQFYLQNNNLEDAVKLTDTSITSNLILDINFQNDIKQYIFNFLLSESTYQKQIKIPNQITVYKIKNEFERLSIKWKNSKINN